MEIGLKGLVRHGGGRKNVQFSITGRFVMHNLHLAAVGVEGNADRKAGQCLPGRMGTPEAPISTKTGGSA